MNTHPIEILQFQSGQIQPVIDELSCEEPLELRLQYGDSDQRKSKSLSVTMRTPGDDFQLAAGFLVSEGIVTVRNDITDIRYLPPFILGNQTSNIVEIELARTANFDLSRLQRHFYTTSSCGVCGKASLAAVRTAAPRTSRPVDSMEKTAAKLISPSLICKLPNQLRDRQTTFHKTGGLHGAGLVAEDGQWISVFEDVGRHNAVDKLIGHQLLRGPFPIVKRILVLSGRASFELIQKAVMAQIFMVVAVGAPSSLAVELAAEFGVTLIGFAAANRFNVYSDPHRLELDLPG